MHVFIPPRERYGFFFKKNRWGRAREQKPPFCGGEENDRILGVYIIEFSKRRGGDEACGLEVSAGIWNSSERENELV